LGRGAFARGLGPVPRLPSAPALDWLRAATVSVAGSRAAGLGAGVGWLRERCSKATSSGAATNTEE
jgi:hypothetical protein